jgi:hypothetical protein
MSSYDDGEAAVQGELQDLLGDVRMGAPVERIVGAGRARVARRRVASVAGAAAAGIAISVPALGHPSTAPPGVHISTVAYTVNSQADGTIQVTWDKSRYFQDSAGLQSALRAAGFPVLIKEGVFCKGPHDDGYLDPSGQGHGVDQVMRGQRGSDGRVVFVFTPAAMPAGQELFIGYLNAAQLAVTQGHPGSVERLVPTGVPLTCTTQAPPHAGGTSGGSTGTKSSTGSKG